MLKAAQVVIRVLLHRPLLRSALLWHCLFMQSISKSCKWAGTKQDNFACKMEERTCWGKMSENSFSEFWFEFFCRFLENFGEKAIRQQPMI